MANNFILRISKGENFKNSSFKSIWGIDSKPTASKSFLSRVREGALLWFVTSGSNGQIVAVATFTSANPRANGPLIDMTATNDELGWNQEKGEWDTEIHYKNLYNLTESNLFSYIKGNCAIRIYNENCKVNLPAEYPSIVRYLKVQGSML